MMKTRILSIVALLLMAVTGATAQTYSVTLADGTEDAANWTISPASAAEGETVTIKYTGAKKVKSIKAVKKAAPTYTLLSAATAEEHRQGGVRRWPSARREDCRARGLHRRRHPGLGDGDRPRTDTRPEGRNVAEIL